MFESVKKNVHDRLKNIYQYTLKTYKVAVKMMQDDLLL